VAISLQDVTKGFVQPLKKKQTKITTNGTKIFITFIYTTSFSRFLPFSKKGLRRRRSPLS
jgi:hypothetical protein